MDVCPAPSTNLKFLDDKTSITDDPPKPPQAGEPKPYPKEFAPQRHGLFLIRSSQIVGWVERSETIASASASKIHRAYHCQNPRCTGRPYTRSCRPLSRKNEL